MKLRIGKFTPLFFVMLAIFLWGLVEVIGIEVPEIVIPALFLIGGGWFVVDWLMGKR
jgi:hypothetical protein